MMICFERSQPGAKVKNNGEWAVWEVLRRWQWTAGEQRSGQRELPVQRPMAGKMLASFGNRRKTSRVHGGRNNRWVWGGSKEMTQAPLDSDEDFGVKLSETPLAAVLQVEQMGASMPRETRDEASGARLLTLCGLRQGTYPVWASLLTTYMGVMCRPILFILRRSSAN